MTRAIEKFLQQYSLLCTRHFYSNRLVKLSENGDKAGFGVFKTEFPIKPDVLGAAGVFEFQYLGADNEYAQRLIHREKVDEL
jgi:hypothetical protein